MLQVKNFKRHYGDLLAVNRFSMEASPKEIVGLIGPDGSGKTTILRSIATLQTMEEGEILIDGDNVRTDFLPIRKKLGYMPGQFSLYPDLSVGENLSFFMDIHGVTFDQCKDAIDPIYQQIAPFKDRKAGKLSGGMKQKLALCCALVNQPSLLLLDEPTTGVDPVSRKEFWNILYNYRNQGTSIVVSTPYMDEASICDRILLIHKGQVLEQGTPSELVLKDRGVIFLELQGIRSTAIYQSKEELLKRFPDLYAYLSGKKIRVICSRNAIKHVEQYQKEHFPMTTISQVTPDIEDIFMFHLIDEKEGAE
ncbi:ABC transporter ATP-binding protein [Prolixibacteraceae bacterium]|nr:ABC transporter ATP-binding protein [Prolixibacteraceae bacterium]